MPTDTDPSLTHTLTTHPAALPREADRATVARGLRSDELARFNAVLAERNNELAKLKSEVEIRKKWFENQQEYSASLEAKLAALAKRDGLPMACCKLKIELREAEAKNAALLKQNEFLHGAIADQQGEIGGLLAELAKRDEMIAESEDENANQERRIATRDGMLTSLRAQLARAGAIEAKAKVVLDWWGLKGMGSGRNGNQVMQELADEIASPSPSPVIDASGSLSGNHTHGEFVAWTDSQRGGHDTPDGERLAKLESVASAAKAYVDGTGGDGSAYYLLVRTLEALEVHS